VKQLLHCSLSTKQLLTLSSLALNDLSQNYLENSTNCHFRKISCAFKQLITGLWNCQWCYWPWQFIVHLQNCFSEIW